jgi:maltose/maltodextrin transport system substrate-binding protein/arabinogalactan oligomer/maltooligosaccharide transport system substrate-binding protein
MSKIMNKIERRHMRNRIGLLATALMVVLLSLTACAAPIQPSGTLPPAAPPPAATEVAEEMVGEASAAMVVTAFEDLQQDLVETDASSETALDIWVDETRAPLLAQLGAEFEAAAGAPVNVTPIAFSQILAAVEDAVATGEGPDIIVGSAGWTDELVARDLLLPIDLGEKQTSFLESALDAFAVDGEIYGLPYATENVALVYNPELVSEAPATWSEVAEIAAQLEADGVVQQGFVRQTGDPYHFYPILSAFGGYLFGEGADGLDVNDLGIDGEGAQAAYAWLAEMVANGHLNADALVDYDIMHGMFESGDAAMIVTGPWALPRLRASGIPFVVTELPGEVQPATPYIGVQGFMISALAENSELAQQFLTDFVATDEVMQEIFKGDPRPSAYLPVRAVIEDPDLYGFALAGENGVPEPRLAAMSQIWDDLDQALQEVSRGELTPADALTQAAQRIREDLGQ